MMSVRFCAGVNRTAVKSYISRNQNLHKRFATAVAKELPSDGEVLERNDKQLEGLFPWRSMPPLEQQTIQEGITGYATRRLIKNHFVNGGSVIAPDRCYLEGDFRVGAHAAFKLAMTSIFNHKQILAAEILENQTKESQSPSDGIQNSENTAAGGTAEEAVLRGAIPIDESNNASDPESTEALRQKIQAAKDAKAALDDLCNDVKFVPDLEVIFEERLAAFYESAISQSQKPHMKIFHKIENMGDISIEKYDILLAAKRNLDLTGLRRKKFMGLVPYMSIVERTTTNFDGRDHRKATKAEKNMMAAWKYATVRLLITMPVTETFYVENCLSNTLVQGSKEPVTNMHSVLFETAISSDRTASLEWTICDIDNWLDGNEFWNLSKVKKD